MENGNFLIPLNGLAAGENQFSWHAGKEFFESFGNEEILGADLDLSVSAQKSGRSVEVDCGVEGSVTVSCDRCLADLELPVDLQIGLSVRHEAQQEAPEDEEREVIIISDSDARLDMAQIVYDYVCLSLPLRKVHPEGECDPEVVSRLSDGEPDNDDIEDEDKPLSDNPFAKLQNFIES